MLPACLTHLPVLPACLLAFLPTCLSAGIPSLAGIVVIDVVEGTAVASLPYMETVLQVRCCVLLMWQGAAIELLLLDWVASGLNGYTSS